MPKKRLGKLDENAVGGGRFVDVPANSSVEIASGISLRQKLKAKMAAFVDDQNSALRPNQLRAISVLRTLLDDYNWDLSGYIVQPTGAGKTVTFGNIIKILDSTSLVLIPKTVLLEQTKTEFAKVCGIDPEQIGLVGNNKKEFGRKYTIATYQSFLSFIKSGNPEFAKLLKEIEVLVCDEAHKSLGDATQLAISELSDEEETAEGQAFGLINESKKKILKIAFTATPKLVEKGVKDMFGVEIARESYVSMVRAGILVPFKIFHTEGQIIIGEDVQEGKAMSEEEEGELLSRENIYQKLLDQSIRY